MNKELISYYEDRLTRYLTRVFKRSISGNPQKSIDKIIELSTNVLKAREICSLEWGKLFNKQGSHNSYSAQFIQIEHLLEAAKQAIALLDPDHPASDVLKKALDNHPSKISEQQRANALRPRKHIPFRQLLEEIISKNKNITEKELLRELKKVEGGDVVKALDHDQGIIRVYDDEYRERTYEISGLKDHLRKIRDKLI